MATVNLIPLSTLTARLTADERDEFNHFLGDSVSQRDVATGTVGKGKVNEILRFYMDIPANAIKARGLNFPVGTKFTLGG